MNAAVILGLSLGAYLLFRSGSAEEEVYAPADSPKELPRVLSPKDVHHFVLRGGAQPSKTEVSPERAVWELTNRYRAENGIGPLAWSDVLRSAAFDHAYDMAKRDYFNHVTPEGITPSDRIRDAGWRSSPIGENIAAGQATPEAVLEAWINSPGHRENLLRSSFRSLGVGYYFAPDTIYKYFWVQIFG